MGAKTCSILVLEPLMFSCFQPRRNQMQVATLRLRSAGVAPLASLRWLRSAARFFRRDTAAPARRVDSPLCSATSVLRFALPLRLAAHQGTDVCAAHAGRFVVWTSDCASLRGQLCCAGCPSSTTRLDPWLVIGGLSVYYSVLAPMGRRIYIVLGGCSFVFTYVHVYVYVLCIYIVHILCIVVYTYIYIYIYINAYIFPCMHACMHACMYLFISLAAYR